MRAGRLAGPGANGWRVVAARIKKCSPTPDCTAHEREMADRELKGGHPAVREAKVVCTVAQPLVNAGVPKVASRHFSQRSHVGSAP
jgi:hypothetical protein